MTQRHLELVQANTPASVDLVELSAQLAAMEETETLGFFGEAGVERALKTTISLCSECLRHVPALVFEAGGKALVRKRCPVHGVAEAVLENDSGYYFLSNKDRSGRCFARDRAFFIPEFAGSSGGSCCSSSCSSSADAPELSAPALSRTDQRKNRTCTMLVEVTDACNLDCRVCYSDAAGDRYLPFQQFRENIEALLRDKKRLESVQLTGGEATLHPQFWDMVDYLHSTGRVNKSYVPTNGLKLAQPDYAERAARYADKLMVLLQFDALAKDANQSLRRAHPVEHRQRVIGLMKQANVPMQLTMTVAHGVNTAELNGVLDVALANENVKVVALQPVTWSGRYDLTIDPMQRVTLSDLAKAVMEHPRLKMEPADFSPIPCSHPNCGWITVFLRRFGMLRNVVRYVDLNKAMNDVAYKTLLSTEDLQNVVGTSDKSLLAKVVGKLGSKVVRSKDMFTIAIKPFMDRHNYDQDRVQNCCHHITDTYGVPHSFCEYNAITRPQDSWQRLPTLREL